MVRRGDTLKTFSKAPYLTLIMQTHSSDFFYVHNIHFSWIKEDSSFCSFYFFLLFFLLDCPGQFVHFWCVWCPHFLLCKKMSSTVIYFSFFFVCKFSGLVDEFVSDKLDGFWFNWMPPFESFKVFQIFSNFALGRSWVKEIFLSISGVGREGTLSPPLPLLFRKNA